LDQKTEQALLKAMTNLSGLLDPIDRPTMWDRLAKKIAIPEWLLARAWENVQTLTANYAEPVTPAVEQAAKELAAKIRGRRKGGFEAAKNDLRGVNTFHSEMDLTSLDQERIVEIAKCQDKGKKVGDPDRIVDKARLLSLYFEGDSPEAAQFFKTMAGEGKLTLRNIWDLCSHAVELANPKKIYDFHIGAKRHGYRAAENDAIASWLHVPKYARIANADLEHRDRQEILNRAARIANETNRSYDVVANIRKLSAMDDGAIAGTPRKEMQQMVLCAYAAVNDLHQNPNGNVQEEIALLKTLDRVFVIRGDLLLQSHEETNKSAQEFMDRLMQPANQKLLADISIGNEKTHITDQDKKNVQKLVNILSEIDGIKPPKVQFFKDKISLHGAEQSAKGCVATIRPNVINVSTKDQNLEMVIFIALHEYGHCLLHSMAPKSDEARIACMNAVHYRDHSFYGEQAYMNQPHEEFAYNSQVQTMASVKAAIVYTTLSPRTKHEYSPMHLLGLMGKELRADYPKYGNVCDKVDSARSAMPAPSLAPHSPNVSTGVQLAIGFRTEGRI